MKVCKFEKMKEEDEIRQVINYILKEHPYVVGSDTDATTRMAAGYFYQLVSRRRQCFAYNNQ